MRATGDKSPAAVVERIEEGWEVGLVGVVAMAMGSEAVEMKDGHAKATGVG